MSSLKRLLSRTETQQYVDIFSRTSTGTHSLPPTSPTLQYMLPIATRSTQHDYLFRRYNKNTSIEPHRCWFGQRPQHSKVLSASLPTPPSLQHFTQFFETINRGSRRTRLLAGLSNQLTPRGTRRKGSGLVTKEQQAENFKSQQAPSTGTDQKLTESSTSFTVTSKSHQVILLSISLSLSLSLSLSFSLLLFCQLLKDCSYYLSLRGVHFIFPRRSLPRQRCGCLL